MLEDIKNLLNLFWDGMYNMSSLEKNYQIFLENVKSVFPNVRIPDKTEVIENSEIELSAELSEWFSIIGDADYQVIDVLCGLEILSYENMVKEWNSWRVFEKDKVLNDSKLFSSEPEKAIKCQYTNSKWIPIAHDHEGNYIGVDLDPDEEGKVGQVIDFGRDENDKVVLADSISELFELILENQEDMTDVNGCYTNEDDEHTIDWLKNLV